MLMSGRVPRLLLASMLAVAVVQPSATVTATASSYTVPEGVEVVEVAVAGARGGGSTYFLDYAGGKGCHVQTALEVEQGNELTWVLGDDGESITSAAATVGGRGGAGARPGGNGGDSTGNTSSLGRAAGGGGGASALSLDGTEVIVAAGGGGAGSTGGGGGCLGDGRGGDGFGTTPTAKGASDPAVGGEGGLGTSSSAKNPPPGGVGNSSTDTPAGRGGDGGTVTVINGIAGGGGCGGISGGGGSAGSGGAGGIGSGSGAAGLSGVLVPAPNPELMSPRFEAAAAGGLVSISAVSIETIELPQGSVETQYSTILTSSFQEAFTSDSIPGSPVGEVTWSLATGSSPLPEGLSLSSSGVLAGTPTVPGTATITLAASVYVEETSELRAWTVATLDPEVVSLVGPEPTTTTSEPVSDEATLPATGGSSELVLLIAIGLVLSGAFTLIARRRVLTG